VVNLLVVALAIPALTGIALILSGRGSSPSAEGSANLVSLAASLATAALVVASVITRPVVDQEWLPSLGVRLQFSVDGISAPLLLLTALTPPMADHPRPSTDVCSWSSSGRWQRS